MKKIYLIRKKNSVYKKFFPLIMKGNLRKKIRIKNKKNYFLIKPIINF
jgi:hypothetical protein